MSRESKGRLRRLDERYLCSRYARLCDDPSPFRDLNIDQEGNWKGADSGDRSEVKEEKGKGERGR